MAASHKGKCFMSGKRDDTMTRSAEIQEREIAGAMDRLLRPLDEAEGIPRRFHGEAFPARTQEALFATGAVLHALPASDRSGVR